MSSPPKRNVFSGERSMRYPRELKRDGCPKKNLSKGHALSFLAAYIHEEAKPCVVPYSPVPPFQSMRRNLSSLGGSPVDFSFLTGGKWDSGVKSSSALTQKSSYDWYWMSGITMYGSRIHPRPYLVGFINS
jgi:hypothetical protein